MQPTRAFQFKLSGPALLLLAGTVLLNGCALNGGSSSSAKAVLSSTGTKGFSGIVHGGQNPVTGATVILWAAGAPATGGGYGTGATQVASTTTDGNGNFSLDNSSGVSPCTTGQYLYLTSTGGNSGAGTNNSIAMMAAIPSPCSATTGATSVFIDEVTTVAAVTALQQFMSIKTYSPPYTGTGTVPWTIGAPSTNTTGLANAFLQSGNLASIATGTSGVIAATGTGGTVGATSLITPNSSRINLLADILAYCVNSTGSLCTALFNDTTPNGGTTPVDTIQSMYNIATNPAGLTMPAHATAGSPYWLCSNYVAPGAPFQPTQACSTTAYPVDWTISVTWGASGNLNGTVQAANIAIDGSGNIWTAQNNSSATGGYIVQMNQASQVLQTPVKATTAISTTAGLNASSYTGSQAYALGGARNVSLAIDTNNNAWYTGYYTAAVTVGTQAGEAPVAEITPNISGTPTVTGYLALGSQLALAIDGSNNIYFNEYNGTAARDYVGSFTGSGLTYTQGAIHATGYYGYTAVNQATTSTVNANSTTSYAWIMNNACAGINRTNASVQTSAGAGSPVTVATASPTTCVFWGATDAVGNLWGTDGYLEYIDIRTSTTAPTITQYASGTGNVGGIGGLYGASGVAVDGVGNIWVVNNNGSGANSGGVSEFVPGTNGTTLTALSPSGSFIFGFNNAGYGTTVGAFIENPQSISIDSSGNVWIGTSNGSFLNYIVGVAAPVKTPYAAQIANTAVGTRP